MDAWDQKNAQKPYMPSPDITFYARNCLLTGICGLFFPIFAFVAIYFGRKWFALSGINPNDTAGRRMAQIGSALGYLSIGLDIFAIILLLSLQTR